MYNLCKVSIPTKYTRIRCDNGYPLSVNCRTSFLIKLYKKTISGNILPNFAAVCAPRMTTGINRNRTPTLRTTNVPQYGIQSESCKKFMTYPLPPQIGQLSGQIVMLDGSSNGGHHDELHLRVQLSELEIRGTSTQAWVVSKQRRNNSCGSCLPFFGLESDP
jgi:hypothetical protein